MNKKLYIISMLVLVTTLIVFLINFAIHPLNDWVIRINGIIMLISVFSTMFNSIRSNKDKKSGR